MVMKAMLIGLLVIGAVSMLETDANAFYHCDNWACKEFTPEVLEKKEFTPEVLEKVVDEVKRHKGSEVWIVGFTNQVGKTKEFDRVSREMEDVMQMLIQRKLQPDIFRWLILEGYVPLDPERGGIKVIVAWREHRYQ